MTRSLLALLVAVLLAAATPARATCRWFGSQMDCDVGGSQLLIGTQTAAQPSYATSVRSLHGRAALLGARRPPVWPLRLELQNIGADPSLCRGLGNDIYCY